jgi:phage major head subunit gpT-like protein
MRKLKVLDGQDYLDLMPAFLICGPDQEVAARQMLQSQIVPNSINEVNPFQASMQLIVDPRIEGNKWYLAASPSTVDTIEVAMLEGMSGPEMLQETEFNNDSVKFKCRHIIGVSPISHVGFVKNPGI